MFAKLSLKSFIYNLSEILCFPTKVASEIYKKYLIEKVELFHILTDTDSTALKLIFISDPNSDVPEDKFRDINFEVIIVTKIYKRFDTSQKFSDIFGSIKERRKKKKLGYYEIIDNRCFVTLTVNPKEYFEIFKNLKSNKKHKGIKKGSSGMDFENFVNRIESLVNISFDLLSFNKK